MSSLKIGKCEVNSFSFCFTVLTLLRVLVVDMYAALFYGDVRCDVDSI